MSAHDCIAGGRIEGDVRINGHPKEQDSFARVSGYVEQFDTHSAAATVHESLMFSGILRNEKDIDRDTTEAFVDQVWVCLGYPRALNGGSRNVSQHAAWGCRVHK